MKRKPKTSSKVTAKPASARPSTRLVEQRARAGSQLEQVLTLIRAQPGIRPSEINRRLSLEQSDSARNALIKRGLIRKEKDGSAIRYYAV